MISQWSVLAFLTAACLPAAQLSVGSVTASAGGAASVAITFTGQGSQVTGLQFDLGYDASSMDFTAATGPVADAAGKTLSQSSPTAGSKRILIAGLNQNAIGDGVIATLQITVRASASGTLALAVSNASATDRTGAVVMLAAQGGAVTVVPAGPPPPAASVAIDNASGVAGSTVNVPVRFSPGSGIAGVQFDLSYDPANLSITGTAGGAAGKTLTSSDVSPNVKRFILSGNPSALGAGVLVNLAVAIQNGAPAGNYALDVSAVTGFDSNGGAHPLPPAAANLSVTAAPAQAGVTISSVTNAATNLPGPIAAGELVVVQGSGLGPPNPITGFVASPAFTVDGAAAGIVYAGSTQLAAVIPNSLATEANAKLQVQYRGQTSAASSVPVAPVSPGVFTLDGSGQGQGAVYNQDGSLNSPTNPARKGSTVTLYVTGVGQVNVTGAPVLPLIVGIGNSGALLLSIGPGATAGVLQVQAQVPSDSLAGPSVPLVILIGGIFSQPGVSMAVQ